MTGARQTITVIITFRKSDKDSLEHGAGAPSFIFFFLPDQHLYVMENMCIYTHN